MTTQRTSYGDTASILSKTAEQRSYRDRLALSSSNNELARLALECIFQRLAIAPAPSPHLVTQFCSLERRTARGGRDSIDHAPGGHDDLANAVAGAAALALGHQGVVVTRELLQRVAAMPVNPARKHTAWGFRRRAALANMVIPREH